LCQHGKGICNTSTLQMRYCTWNFMLQTSSSQSMHQYRKGNKSTSFSGMHMSAASFSQTKGMMRLMLSIYEDLQRPAFDRL
jgi:hypothetical protein